MYNNRKHYGSKTIEARKDMSESDQNEQERRKLEAITMSAGLSRCLDKGGKHIQAYADLLEEEWDGRHSALHFIKDGRDIVQNLLAWNNSLISSLHEGVALELLSIQPLLEGVARNCPKAMKEDFRLDVEKDSFALVHATLLQSVLLEMARAVSELPQCQELGFSCFTEELDSSTCSILRTDVEPGTYIAIALTSYPIQELYLDEYVAIAEYKGNYWTGGESPSPRFLHWLGTAALHKGELLVHKDNGSGEDGSLLFLLPRSSAVSDGNLNAKTVNGRPETILVVDDEDMIWLVVINMLNSLGYTVLLAENGKEAVDIYKGNPGAIDLVLLDMVMPVMNAHEAFPLLKEADPNVRVLLASGYVEEEDVQDLLSNGAISFMRKPYLLKDLARRIRDILDKTEHDHDKA